MKGKNCTILNLQNVKYLFQKNKQVANDLHQFSNFKMCFNIKSSKTNKTTSESLPSFIM